MRHSPVSSTNILVIQMRKLNVTSIILIDILLILTIILLVLLFFPYLNNGYWHDDSLNSQVYWMIQKSNGDLFDFSWRVVKHWLLASGRPMLVFFPSYSHFYYFHDLTGLRLAHFFSVIISVVTWGLVLHKLKVPKVLIYIWAVMFFGLFQVHANGLDPVAGFAFHYQILLVQLSILLLIFLRWMSSDRNNIGLMWVLLVWFLFMGFYEINIIFIPIVAMFILLEKKYQFDKKKKLMIISGALLLYLIAYFFIQKIAPSTYAGAKLGFDTKLFVAYLQQISASFPSSAYFGAVNGSLSIRSLIDSTLNSYISWVIFFSGTISFLIACRLLPYDTKVSKQTLFLSSLMIFLPPVFPAISSRYQNEVSWGVGTLPVYYQWIGMSFLIVFGLLKLQTHFNSRILILVSSIFFGSYLALTFTSNSFIINAANTPWFDQRESFRVVANQGLFSHVKNGDIVEVNGCAHYINSNLIYQHTSRRVYVPTDDYYWFPDRPSDKANKFKLVCLNGTFSLNKLD